MRYDRFDKLGFYGVAKNAFWIYGNKPAVAKFMNILTTEGIIYSDNIDFDDLDDDDDFLMYDLQPDEPNDKPNAVEESAKLEIDTMKKTRHPNIVQIFGSVIDKIKGQILLLLEYGNGGDLQDLINDLTCNYSDFEAIKWCGGLACALKYLHFDLMDNVTVLHLGIVEKRSTLFQNFHIF